MSAGDPAMSPMSAIVLSLHAGLWCTVAGFPVAVGLGWILARTRFRGRTLLAGAVLAPLVLPPVVTGFLLLELVGRGGPFGNLGIAFTAAAPVLAAFVVGLPLYVMTARNAFEAVDPRYEELSWTLGVPPRPTFVRVTLPLALPGLAAGAVLAFSRALGEFGATVVLAGNIEGRTRTIPLAIYTLLQSPGGNAAVTLLVGASLAVSLAAVVAYELFSQRQRQRGRAP